MALDKEGKFSKLLPNAKIWEDDSKLGGIPMVDALCNVYNDTLQKESFANTYRKIVKEENSNISVQLIKHKIQICRKEAPQQIRYL